MAFHRHLALALALLGAWHPRAYAQQPIRTAPGIPVTLPGRQPTAPPRRDAVAVAPAPARVDSAPAARKVAADKLPSDSTTFRNYRDTVSTAKFFLVAWFLLVLGYLVWAIRRYVFNYGISDREWKVLYPEVYEMWWDRLFAKLRLSKPYRQRREELIEARLKERSREAALRGGEANQPDAPITPFAEPQKNPYEGDSFGLPPGTIRGILALTVMVMFLLIELVNLTSPLNLEDDFKELLTAFEMVLAFYFGSRAVEVLQAKSRAEPAPAPGGGGAASSEAAALPATRAAEVARDTGAVIPASGAGPATSGRPSLPNPADRTLLPEANTMWRFANVASMARDARPAGQPIDRNVPAEESLAKRVLALTASFETGRGFPRCFGTVAGNFDGQGISFGALQWNIGQGSVQPLWEEMRDKQADLLRKIMGPLHDDFVRMLGRSKDQQMQWALELQHLVSERTNAWRIVDNWRIALENLGQCDPMIAIQVRRAEALFQTALAFCRDYELASERGAALMFDIRVQNGSVDRNGSGERIRTAYELINPALTDVEREIERMRIVARERSAVANPQFRTDVLNRKLTIAEGEGTVHGRKYRLEEEFAISIGRPAFAAQPIAVA